MIKRTTPRNIPEDHPSYVEVTLHRGVHHLRVPSTLVGARIMGSIPAELVETLRAAKGGGDVLAMARGAGPQGMALMGHIVGMAWHHRDLDLESVPLPKEDTLAHGERVFEELHEAGYTLDEILSLGFVVVAEWITANGKAAEALARADFFGRLKGATTSSPSTSGSTSSEIPGDLES